MISNRSFKSESRRAEYVKLGVPSGSVHYCCAPSIYMWSKIFRRSLNVLYATT